MRRTRLAIVGLAFVVAGVVSLTRPSEPLEGAPVPHDIPADAIVRMFVKPEGDRLRLLVRVPLNTMQDIVFPTFGPGYLDIPEAEDEIRQGAMLWIGTPLQLFENGERLPVPELVAAVVSIPSDRSFTSYEAALAHVTGPPLAPETQLVWQQALLDILFEYPIASADSDFSMDPGLERLALRVNTILRFLPAEGSERLYQYTGHPGVVRLDPRWHQAAWRFVVLGFQHILDGIDHLLFLLCLVAPLRKLRSLVILVTAFTVAHSVTLAASAFNFAPNTLWFPPLVETLIAASIVYMALENIVGTKVKTRWIITFAFGLAHGFGFSFALRETMQFAGSHLVTSLLAFNVGVELGQLAALLIIVPALELLYRFAIKEKIGNILLAALVAHTAWHWMTERWGVLTQYTFRWPVFDLGLLARTLALVALTLAVMGATWLVIGWIRRPEGKEGGAGEVAEETATLP